MDFNETLGEKTRCWLYEDDSCCFVHILEAGRYKTAAAQTLTSHLANNPRKTSKACLWSKNELVSDVVVKTPSYTHTSFGRLAKAYINQLSGGTGWRLADLSNTIANLAGWWEKVTGICAIGNTRCWLYIYIYIYIYSGISIIIIIIIIILIWCKFSFLFLVDTDSIKSWLIDW